MGTVVLKGWRGSSWGFVAAGAAFGEHTRPSFLFIALLKIQLTGKGVGLIFDLNLPSWFFPSICLSVKAVYFLNAKLICLFF